MMESDDNVNKCFVLTGFHSQEREKFSTVISSMKASLHSDSLTTQNIEACTHVIARKPCKSEKFLCSCASGKWILHHSYLVDCYRAKKWLNEEDYEWSRQQINSITTRNLAKAANRWRQTLTNGDGKRPFHGCTFGLIVTRSFDVFRRLIEIGGGKVVGMSTSSTTELTHVIADAELSKKVEEYHKRGIPCVRCEYLAERIVQYPPPSTWDFTLFPAQIKAVDKFTNKNEEAMDTEDTAVEAMDIDGANSNPNPSKTTKPNEELDAAFIASSSQLSSSSIFSRLKEADVRQNHSSSFLLPTGRNDAEPIVAQQNVELALVDQTSSRDSAISGTSSNQLSVVNETKKVHLERRDELSAKTHPSFKQQQTDQERKDIASNIAASCQAISSSCQDNASALPTSAIDQQHTAPKMQTDSPAHDYCAPEIASETCLMTTTPPKPSDVDANEATFNWSSKKRELIHDAMIEMRKEKEADVGRSKVQVLNPAGSHIMPRRIGNREMTLLENSVDVSHSNSVLITCRILISKEKYPPPDLLFLIMKKYLLECDNPSESSPAAALLQSIISFHPPSSLHIQKDDIYSQAFSITSASNSTLLMLSKLSLNGKVRLWNDVKESRPEKDFFKTILKQAIGILQGHTQRRDNAIVLLAFITGILEQHHVLTDKIFWNSGTKLIKLVLRFFHIVVETDIQNKAREMSDDDAQISSEVDSETNDSDDDKQDNRFEEIRLVGEIQDCLSRIITLLFAHNPSKRAETLKIRREIVGSALAEEFDGADHKVVRSMLALVTFPAKSNFLQLFLSNNFSDCLAKSSKEEPLSIYLIVQRYFYFVPKSSSAQNFISKATSSPKHNLSPPRPRKTSEDKSPVKKSPYLSAEVKLTSANVNRRNPKGETALHRACIMNQCERVVQLLSIPGVDPNAGDYAGWTPLSEACNRGYIDIVQQLLKLPLKAKDSELNPQETPRLEIDLRACPEEGTTPLHDTLSNEHVEVAKLLIEKGGVELLYVTDKQGNSPLDACEKEDTRCEVLEFALDLSSRACEQTMSDTIQTTSTIPTYYLPEQSSYAEILPSEFSNDWLNSCQVYMTLIQSLLSACISEKSLLRLLIKISRKPAFDSEEKENLRCYKIVLEESSSKELEVSHIERDISYLLNWEEMERTFKEHLKVITGDSSFITSYSALSKDIRSILVNIF